jgi:hypothetical protein
MKKRIKKSKRKVIKIQDIEKYYAK